MDDTRLFWIAANQYGDSFPPVNEALTDPDGLLAVGGQLTVDRLLEAYKNGIFPWYSNNQPILWWSPNPRTILYPGQIHISRSLKKTINRKNFTITCDQAFEQVIKACSMPRSDDNGTWLMPEMIDAYIKLHHHNYAHSVECWQDDNLVGGLYGIAIGRVFFGESMFSRISDASKICLVKLSAYLQEWNYDLIDCQVQSDHLLRMGAVQITREKFMSDLEHSCSMAPSRQSWNVS